MSNYDWRDEIENTVGRALERGVSPADVRAEVDHVIETYEEES